MKHRELEGENRLLRIYVGEGDKHEHKRAYDELIELARQEGLAGCSIFSGFAGFGSGRKLHSSIEQEGAGSLARVIELIDEPARIAEFRKKLGAVLGSSGLITEQKVLVLRVDEQAKEKRMAAGSSTQTVMLRIFVDESDKCGHEALYLELIKRAYRLKLAGCTAIRGMAGFGATSVIHEDHAFRLSQDLPVVLELVDEGAKIEAFLSDVSPLLSGALVTSQKVAVQVPGVA